jgi:hypothetical protein
VTELTVEQFGQWRRHPVTELMFDRYISDFLRTLTEGVTESWLAGNLSLQVEQDARGYIHAMRHLQGIRLPDLRSFWNVTPPAGDFDPHEPRRFSSGTGY